MFNAYYFFIGRNEKEAKKHEIIVPNVYVRIFPNGSILYSIRYFEEFMLA